MRRLLIGVISQRSTSFFVFMVLASGFGFFKVLILAYLLQPSAFGHYVSVFGAATLSGTLCSFGAVEGTIKRYPRLWVENRITAIRADAARVVTRLVASFSAATIIAAALAHTLGFAYSTKIVLLGGTFGLITSLLSLAASVLRASSASHVLRTFQFNRSLLALLGATIGASIASWEGALGGEVLCGGLSLVLVRLDIGRLFKKQTAVAAPASREPGTKVTGGSTLYFSNILSTAPFLTDRAMINAALGPAVAGSYGVVAMIFQIGVLIANILTQWAGADIIKAIHGGNYAVGRFRFIAKYFGLLLAAVLLAVSAVTFLKFSDFPSGFFDKYNISYLSILLGGVIGLTHIYALLEFILIAKDREDSILLASISGTTCFYGAFGFAWYYKLPLEAFLGFALAARSLHVIILSAFIRRSYSTAPARPMGSSKEQL